jgi:hypothetical protein
LKEPCCIRSESVHFQLRQEGFCIKNKLAGSPCIGTTNIPMSWGRSRIEMPKSSPGRRYTFRRALRFTRFPPCLFTPILSGSPHRSRPSRTPGKFQWGCREQAGIFRHGCKGVRCTFPHSGHSRRNYSVSYSLGCFSSGPWVDDFRKTGYVDSDDRHFLTTSSAHDVNGDVVGEPLQETTLTSPLPDEMFCIAVMAICSMIGSVRWKRSTSPLHLFMPSGVSQAGMGGFASLNSIPQVVNLYVRSN